MQKFQDYNEKINVIFWQRFIEEFKATYNKAHHGTMEAAGHVELAPLLTEEYDISTNNR